MKNIFPVILIIIDLGAAVVYLWYGEWAKFFYWLFAAGLTTAVLWM